MWPARPGSRPSWPLRWHLTLLIAGTLLPVVAFSGVVVLKLSSQMREAIERRLQSSAHMMTLDFEREVSSSIRTLQALAQSASLDRGDLETFRAEASRVQQTQPSWLTVLLLSTDGQQLINASHPPGAPLPRAAEPDSLRRTIETRQPTVGDLARGKLTGRWAFPIRVPVLREGQLRYVLTAVIAVETLANIVTPEGSGEELTRTLVDSQGTIASRTRNPERFIGTPATPLFIEQTRAAPEGLFRSTTLEGAASYVAFSRSPLSGWTSAVVVPVDLINAPFRQSLLAIAATGALALLISTAGALFFSRRFARGIHSVANAAAALEKGGQPQIEPSPIAEVDRLGTSLSLSAERLRQHAQEEQRARRGLEEAVRARDEFLSLASHELKTPLTSLMLQTQLLQHRLLRDGLLSPESVRKLLDQTHRQGLRLARLIDDMLDISRLAAGKLALDTERFDLTAFAAEVVTKLGPQLSEARCDVSVIAQEPVFGTWDRFRLEQVLTNLLVNAARYGASTPVEVTVSRRGDQAELRVRDHGRGIAPEDQARIFRKFERAVSSSEIGGLGLGLFIVRELVEMHGGSVHVESAPGKGATFIVRLPGVEAQSVEEGNRESIG